MKAAIQYFCSAQSVTFYKSVLGILRRDTNSYLKLAEVRNFLVSLQYFTVPYSAQFMKQVGLSSYF